jgi:hypothetical protein
MKPLPVRPQWYKDMIATLRAQRKAGKIPPHEFLELGTDEAQNHPEYVRDRLRDDIAAYDRKVGAAQAEQIKDDIAIAEARKWLQDSLMPLEMLEKLGLDAMLELGFGKKVATIDATAEDRQRAIDQLEHKRLNSNAGIDEKIAAIKHLNELAGDKTLREIIDDRPDEYGTGEL